MAKGSQFWGNASGKLGQQVLYRAGGEQRARMHVAKIKNPKTLAQMENRIAMRNFAQVFRSLKPILSQSFPNRPIKESGFNAFVKANKGIGSPVVPKEGALKGLSVPYNMVVSQGYLTQFGEFSSHEIFGENVPCFDLTTHPNISEIASVWASVEGGVINTQAILAEVWEALQLPSNAVITTIYCTYEDEGYLIKYAQIRKDATDAQLNAMTPKLYLGGTDQLGEDPLPYLSLGESFAESSMYGIIISWVDGNGKLQVTNSRIVPADMDSTYPNQFVKGGEVYEQVLQQYGYTESSTL